MKRPVIQESRVGGSVVRIPPPPADELVEVLELPVVSRIDDDAPVRIDRDRGRLVSKTSERRALDRVGRGVMGVDFDDPAEPVRLARFLLEVETGVMGVPTVGRAAQSMAQMVPCLVGLGRVATEIPSKILFRRQHRSPWGDAPAAIRDRAHDRPALGIGRCAEPGVARRRATDEDRRVERRDPSGKTAWPDDPPPISPLSNLDDGQAMRRHLDTGAVRLRVGEHHAGRRVLVIDT